LSRAGLAVFAERFSFAAASELHGLEHWKRVGAVGAQLAAETLCADPAVIGAFSVFHDSQRRNDSDDPGHGARGAQLAAEMRRQGLLQLDDDQFALLVEACVGHTDGQTSFDPTVGCCWDADRLDLGRVGMRPAAEFLSTLAARRRVDVPTCGCGRAKSAKAKQCGPCAREETRQAVGRVPRSQNAAGRLDPLPARDG